MLPSALPGENRTESSYTRCSTLSCLLRGRTSRSWGCRDRAEYITFPSSPWKVETCLRNCPFPSQKRQVEDTGKAPRIAVGHGSEGLKACWSHSVTIRTLSRLDSGRPEVTHRRDLGLGYKRPEGPQALKPEPPAGLTSSSSPPSRPTASTGSLPPAGSSFSSLPCPP